MALSRQALRLSGLSRALPSSTRCMPSIVAPTPARPFVPNRPSVQCRSLRLFNGGDDNDFFASTPGAFFLDPRTAFPPSLLTSSSTTIPSKHIALDVLEKPEAFEVKADVPGVPEEQVKLSVDGDVLSLSVENQNKENRETKEEGGVKVHRIERSATFVRRAIRLPESADTENIDANLRDGVLTVNIPKREKAARQRRIAIGKGNGASAIADTATETANK